MIERLEEIERDCRTDAAARMKRADRIEQDSGKDKGYGIALGEALAFEVVANRIAGEISELRYA